MSDPTLNQDEIDALLADVGDPTEEAPEETAAVDAVAEPEAAVGGDDLGDLGLDDIGDIGDVSSDDAGMGGDDMNGDDMDLGGLGDDDAADDLAAMLDDSPADDMGDLGEAAPAAEPAAASTSNAPSVMAEFSQKNIEVLLDVPLQIIVELGRAQMPIQKILELGPGSIVELNRMSGEPINILVNSRLVAKGEVVVVDENFGIKITSIISPMERLTQLN